MHSAANADPSAPRAGRVGHYAERAKLRGLALAKSPALPRKPTRDRFKVLVSVATMPSPEP